MQLELFFNIRYICTIPKGVEWNSIVLILCHDSTGCDEMGDYFATEADTKVGNLRLA